MTQDKLTTFRELHVPGRPLVLFNIWDAGSAKAVAAAGAPALATGSWSVAAAHGFVDGEQIPLELALDNLRRIVAAVELPVSVDLEGGYGAKADVVAETVRRAADAGAIGCNLEDGIVGGSGHYSIADQAARLRAARTAAPAFFINARVDLFLDNKAEQHQALMAEALARAAAYADAGADGIFVPGLADEALIGRFCEACTLPVNVMASPSAPDAARLAALGVARISHGPGPYRRAMAFLEQAAKQVYGPA
jgi:2-methylisocitrate lyase-like PEP mutase family enzyme